jgi:5-methylcytosine-specific restriction endonuclease McrA
MATCFYCDVPLVVYPHVEGRTVPDDMHTRDHIIPRKIARPLSASVKKKNIVDACYRCNNDKGYREPLHWLGSYKLSDSGAERLADKLLELGYADVQVDRALNNRKHAVANHRKNHERA